MNTKITSITVRDIEVEVVRKGIKNLHLGVYPPHGRVRVAAPLNVNDEAVRLAVISRLGWIRKQQARFESQTRQSKREMVNGESHYFWGKRYRLNVIEHDGPARVDIRNKSFMDLYMRPGTDPARREQVIWEWYRGHLKDAIQPLVEKWEKKLGVSVSAWGVKKMKTKWGSCNRDAGRIWLNLELAKKPPQCLEYIVVHEMMHLLERHHNDRFTALIDKHLPQWRLYREELNKAPLAHEAWNY